MKFKYKRYGPDLLRPVIPIVVRYGGLATDYEVLVDSGADLCIFDADIASILNIDLSASDRSEVAGITGVKESYAIVPVIVEVGGHRREVNVGFLPGLSRYGYGVVGQRGFFDQFIVKFDLLKEEIELKLR